MEGFDPNIKVNPNAVDEIITLENNESSSAVGAMYAEKDKTANLRTDKSMSFCNACQKGYTTGKGLRAHNEVKHEGFRYDCYECSHPYTNMASLKVHKRFVHKGLGYMCRLCKVKNYSTQLLNTHLRKIHKMWKTQADAITKEHTIEQLDTKWNNSK